MLSSIFEQCCLHPLHDLYASQVPTQPKGLKSKYWKKLSETPIPEANPCGLGLGHLAAWALSFLGGYQNASLLLAILNIRPYYPRTRI